MYNTLASKAMTSHPDPNILHERPRDDPARHAADPARYDMKAVRTNGLE